MNKIYTIYKVENKINKKCYIGYDSNWPKRKETHFYRASSDKSKHYHLHKAIRKYGWDNFDWQILYQSKNKKNTLKKIEPFFIKKYNSFKNGYNETLGGDGTFGKKQSKINKQKQSEYMILKNKNSRWYNNGLINKFSLYNPGKNWKLGRLNQKPTTKDCKWYNNGIYQKLTKTPPTGWQLGMIRI